MDTPVIKSNFIPKKTVTRRRGYKNIFFTISLVILVLAVTAWGGLLVYQNFLSGQKTNLENELEKKTADLVDLEFIEKFKILDGKIKAINTLLDTHTNAAVIFSFLESNTLSNSIRYTSFDYEFLEDGGASVNLAGEARSFASLAYQAQVIEENSFAVNSLFDNFSVDELGNVKFHLQFNIELEAIKFGNNLAGPEEILSPETDLDGIVQLVN